MEINWEDWNDLIVWNEFCENLRFASKNVEFAGETCRKMFSSALSRIEELEDRLKALEEC